MVATLDQDTTPHMSRKGCTRSPYTSRATHSGRFLQMPPASSQRSTGIEPVALTQLLSHQHTPRDSMKKCSDAPSSIKRGSLVRKVQAACDTSLHKRSRARTK